MVKWRKRNKEVKNKSFKKGKEDFEVEEEEFIKETISDEPLEEKDDEELEEDDEESDDDYDDESDDNEEDEEYQKIDEEEEEYQDEYGTKKELMDGSYIESKKPTHFKNSVEEELQEDLEEVQKKSVQQHSETSTKPKTIVEKETTTPTTPKKIDKNLDTETNTFIEIPEKYLLRLTPRARAIITHFSYLIKKNRRNDKNKKKSINDISKFSSLNEFFNTCIVAYGQSLIFDQQATLRKDDIVSVDDKLITLMNLLTTLSLKTNLLIRNQKAQIEADYADDYADNNGVMPITKEDFKELEQITQITKALEINQNRWREEQSKESAEKDLRDLEETIRVVEIPIMEEKVDKQKKELIAARKEITRLKKQLGEK